MNTVAMKAGWMKVAPRTYINDRGDRAEFLNDNRSALINGERFTGPAMTMKIQELSRH